MAAPPIPIVWAKLKAPRLAAGAVMRSELVDRLDRDSALIAIVAPAGYGKTTAAVQLVTLQDRATAWISLERLDDDPVRFWTYVAAALSSAGVARVENAYTHLSSGEAGIPSAISALGVAIEAFSAPITLVLDDFHEIANQDIHAGLSSWLRNPIDNFSIVCTSRSDLPLPVARLRSQDRLGEARIDELAFDVPETQELLRGLFNVRGVDARDVELLFESTKGWPVGLQLAGIGLREGSDVPEVLERLAGGERHISEYLTSEVMDGLDDDTRTFVLATCIVRILDPELCDVLTGTQDSLRMLRRLTAENVFTFRLDADRELFQYHPLLREHLLSVVEEQHPAEVAELHARCSSWFEERGDVGLAIEHAVSSGQIEHATMLMKDSWAQFASAGHFGTLTGWVDLIGDVVVEDTGLCLMMSWAALNLRRNDELQGWIDAAIGAAKTPADRERIRTESPCALAHHARHVGDVGQYFLHASEAFDANKDIEPSRVGEPQSLRAAIAQGAIAAAGSAAFFVGDHDLARAHMQEVIRRRGEGDASSVTFAFFHLAMLEAEFGDPSQGLAWADEGLAKVMPGTEGFHQPTLAYLARSISLWRQGRPADAEDDLRRAREIHEMTVEPLNSVLIELQQARIDHANGDQPAARASIRSARSTATSLPDTRFDAWFRRVENDTRFVSFDASTPAGARELTERELAVIKLLPHDLKRKELAAQMHVSENTIKTHLTSIGHKLGVSGRASIVQRAEQLDLLP